MYLIMYLLLTVELSRFSHVCPQSRAIITVNSHQNSTLDLPIWYVAVIQPSKQFHISSYDGLWLYWESECPECCSIPSACGHQISLIDHFTSTHASSSTFQSPMYATFSSPCVSFHNSVRNLRFNKEPIYSHRLTICLYPHIRTSCVWHSTNHSCG